ncbi:MAG: hypothetical protein AB8G77_24690 [Rhodothermales bacterium]
MILPEPRKDAVHQRGKAFLSTIVFAAVCYGCLLFASISVEKPSRRIFREVDLASFAPPAATPEIPTTTEDTNTPDTETVETEPVVQEASAQSLDQLDLAQLFPDELTVDVDPLEPVENTRNAQADANNAGEQIEVKSGGLQGLGSLDALDDLGGAPVPASRGRTARQSGQGNAGGISIADGSNSVSPTQNTNTGGTTAVVGGNTSRAATAAEADFNVERLSLDSFGNDYQNLEVQELIAWMKANPGEMPVGVRKLVRHRDAFLTSATSFELDGKRYELFLMCKERLMEVHIVLVDVDEATYLIDRSFQKLSTYLREGRVGRTSAQGITAINSQRSAASDERSNEFYSLFLSWWEIAKNEG